MSLSKPEVAAYVGISSAIGLVLAYLLAKDKIIEKNRPVRDTEEGKQVGKQVTLKRKKTGTDLG